MPSAACIYRREYVEHFAINYSCFPPIISSAALAVNLVPSISVTMKERTIYVLYTPVREPVGEAYFCYIYISVSKSKMLSPLQTIYIGNLGWYFVNLSLFSILEWMFWWLCVYQILYKILCDSAAWMEWLGLFSLFCICCNI